MTSQDHKPDALIKVLQIPNWILYLTWEYACVEEYLYASSVIQ